MKNQEVSIDNTGDNSGVMVGENSGKIENHFHNGMSPQDAAQQALALFQSNFPILEKIAADTARARADEIANELFNQIAQKCPDKFEHFSDPDIQYNLIEVEKAYARSGKAALKEILASLLVRRVHSDNDLVNICLNEAIKLVPSLTTAQLDMLSLKFLVGYTQRNSVTDINSLTQYIQTNLLPFVQYAEPSPKDAAHLSSFRCGQESIGTGALGIALAKHYPSIFNIVNTDRTVGDFELMPPIGTPDDYSQFKVRDNGNEVNINQYILSKIPIAAKIFHYYDGWLYSFELTSLGKLIGAINAEIKIHVKLDLSVWI